MKKQITVSAKSIEEALTQASVEFGVPAEEIKCEVITEPKKGFLGIGSVPGEYSCVYGKDNADKAIGFLTNLLNNMGLENAKAVYDTELYAQKNELSVTIEGNGDDVGTLIGHHGETLDSIQYLVNLSALRKSKQKDGDYVKIVVDIENYREKREETLRVLARRMAAKAVKYKRNVFLEPMNAYERRIIHSELQNVENVSTHSVGTDRDRKIIITYEGTDKAPENKNRRRRNPRPHNDNVNGENAGIEAAETTESGEKAQGSGSNRERRRPKKVQKMPIEKIGDILPDSDSAESEE